MEMARILTEDVDVKHRKDVLSGTRKLFTKNEPQYNILIPQSLPEPTPSKGPKNVRQDGQTTLFGKEDDPYQAKLLKMAEKSQVKYNLGAGEVRSIGILGSENDGQVKCGHIRRHSIQKNPAPFAIEITDANDVNPSETP